VPRSGEGFSGIPAYTVGTDGNLIEISNDQQEP